MKFNLFCNNRLMGEFLLTGGNLYPTYADIDDIGDDFRRFLSRIASEIVRFGLNDGKVVISNYEYEWVARLSDKQHNPQPTAI